MVSLFTPVPSRRAIARPVGEALDSANNRNRKDAERVRNEKSRIFLNRFVGFSFRWAVKGFWGGGGED